ncbi:hypothetical protein [Sporosarcina globispora]|uniref:hypothetical protein n=1 Tax=Sporosarcina globispora TaxID=1459 RepID=UPI0013792595|nr:hypothetical protein [Sporosarcina globispora]
MSEQNGKATSGKAAEIQLKSKVKVNPDDIKRLFNDLPYGKITDEPEKIKPYNASKESY